MMLFGSSLIPYAIAGGLSAIVASGATYELVHNANAVEIASLQTNAANTKAASATAALSQLQAYIFKMNDATSYFRFSIQDIDNRFGVIDGELANAFKQKPLPVDCKPDTGRVRSLAAAIAAANASAAAGQPVSGTVPTAPKPISR